MTFIYALLIVAFQFVGGKLPPVPGAHTDMTAAQLCAKKFTTKSVRPPSAYTTRLKLEQMRTWHLPGKPSDYEEDHLISLELGGDPTSPMNLWPQPYEPRPGASEKDKVENFLHREVCAGRVTLADAQRAIATDWTAVVVK